MLAHLSKLLIAGLAILLACTTHAEEWGLDQLMSALAQTRSGHASFVEKKTLAILQAPIESSGELFYSAPYRLDKRTLKPKAEYLLLDHGTLTIEQGRKKHVLQLQNYPELAVFIDSIRGTLAGDRTALERSYKLRLEGDEQAWTLELLPTDNKIKKVVEKILIAGEGSELRSIAISQANGDNSVMTITQLPAP